MWDTDTLWTQNGDSTVQMIPPLDEIAHSTAKWPGIAAMDAMAGMVSIAKKASMAAMAKVMRAMGIRDLPTEQNVVRTLSGYVQRAVSQEIGSTRCKHPQKTS
jgi:hypothetical protein